jgi:hypothetical protein
MALLHDALDASGGMDRWKRFSRFTLHLSVSGALFSNAGHSGEFRDMTADGSTRTQSVRFTGITRGERSGSFDSNVVTIESLEGEVLRSWLNPPVDFLKIDAHSLADELHLVFFCGVAIWSYLTAPFLLAHPDVVVEELSPHYEKSERWRRLRARFPSHIVTLTPEQIFYFDDSALQRRTDHDLFGERVAHHSWAHSTFCGVVVPTLRQMAIIKPMADGIANPTLLDTEIFDAVFE